MFLTRSIRRKLLLGAALVMLMLLALSLSGISGLLSYRSVVNHLDYSINFGPRSANLVAAIGMLLEPLLYEPGDEESFQSRRQDFMQRLIVVESQVQEFRTKLDQLPPTPPVELQRPVSEQCLAQIALNLADLRFDQQNIRSLDQWRIKVPEMQQRITEMQRIALGIPNPQMDLNATLQSARDVYRSRFWLISVASATVFVLFLGLLRCGYVWIFAPIRRLHQGARRVAQGDFDYRLHLATNDEMAELAEAFNQMTSRFQEIAADLDRQVRERSKQLVRSERLAGVGFLAAGVAHEINNPLSAIAMAAESLEGRLSDLAQGAEESEAAVVRQYLGMIQREAFRCQQITARLLDFSRGQDGTRQRHDLTAIVTDVVDMVSHLSKFRDRKVEFAPHGPCDAEVNGPEIKQVMLNLIANGLESMDAGGRLRVEIADSTDGAVITFQDTGCGMTPDVIDNLFEPFFTMKKSGKGTGLGLSISHRIISDHGGTIEATSDGPGRGSTFRVHLPRRARVPAAA